MGSCASMHILITTTNLRDSFDSCASNFLIFFLICGNFVVSTNTSCVCILYYNRWYALNRNTRPTLFGSFVYRTPFHSPSSFRIGFFSLTRRMSAVTRCLLPPYNGYNYAYSLMVYINCKYTLQWNSMWAE